MNDLTQSIEELKQEIPSAPTIINEFFTTTAKYSPLLDPENQTHIGIEKKERGIHVNEPAFIRRIEISGNAGEIIKDIALEINAGTKKIIPKPTKLNDTTAQFMVNSIALGIKIKSNHILVKPEANKIKIIGYPFSQFAEISEKIKTTIDTIYNIESKIEKYKKQNLELETKSEVLKSEKESLENEIIEASKEKTTTEEELNKTEEELELLIEKTNIQSIDLQNKLTHFNEAKNNHDQLTEQVKDLNKSISAKKSELTTIINDRNLISDEYRDYVKEGKGQSKLYSILATISLSSIIFCIYQLYHSASKLLFTDYVSASDILSNFILRIPFALVFGLGILYSWKLSKSLFSKIFKIHEDRLNLAKLLIIAKDTVYSAAHGLEIEDQTRFQERIRLKVAILKSHLAKDLEKDFEYKPAPLNTEEEKDTALAEDNEPGMKRKT